MVDMTSKIAEAEQCEKNAQKYLKTSIIQLKFTPDYGSAAAEYERAAVCYKNAQKKEKCKEMHLKAADMHMQNGSGFHSAKSKEQAALMCRDLGDMPLAKSLMEECATLYAESGSSEIQAQALEKAAQFFERDDPKKAVEIYKKAVFAVSETDKTKQLSEFQNRITKLSLRSEDYRDALTSIQSELAIYREFSPEKLPVLALCQTLVAIKIGDSVEARKLLEVAAGMSQLVERSEEAQSSVALINAFEDGDKTRWNKVLSEPCVKALGDDYLRLMKRIDFVERSENGANADADEEEEDLR